MNGAENHTAKNPTTEAHDGENRHISHLLRLNELLASAVIVMGPQCIGLAKNKHLIQLTDPLGNIHHYQYYWV